MLSRLLFSLLIVFGFSIPGCASFDDGTRYNPRIGMTKEQVRGSVWSTPKRMNKTTIASGTYEQWVYAGPSYLYFNQRGILEMIDSPYLP